LVGAEGRTYEAAAALLGCQMETAGGGATCIRLPTSAVGDLLFLLAEAVASAPGGGLPPGRPPPRSAPNPARRVVAT
jgi:hypothetical protein